jgi:glycosyltransferase involved in cell wall biosynthesis
MSSPAVSIVVPTYNAASYLDEFLRSVQQQTFEDFELLLGDDGSTDNSIEIIQPYLKDPRFRLFQWKKNRGVHTGTFHILMQAQGKYWCYPGTDDVLMPDFIKRRAGILLDNPDASVVHGPGEWIDEKGEPLDSELITRGLSRLLERLPTETCPGEMLRMLVQHNFINVPSVMVRMDITKQILVFWAPYWKWALDWHLWILIASTGFNFLWDPVKLHKYRVHLTSNSVSPAMQAVRKIERHLVILQALRAASQFSLIAFRVWREYRTPLYQGWLVKAASLAVRNELLPEHFAMGVNAYYGGISHHANIRTELLRHGLTPWISYFREQQAHQKQIFRVSGLARVNHPIFSLTGCE